MGTVTVTVTPVNDVPQAVDDRYTTAEDQALNVPAPGVRSNDRDVDGDPLTARVVRLPRLGSLVLLGDGSFTYTPYADENGTDDFTYLVNDGTADSTTPATVTITVTAMDDPPVAVDDALATDEATPLVVDVSELTGNDRPGPANENNQMVRIVPSGFGSPAHGTVSYDSLNGTVRYAPQANFSGIDTFTYTIDDGRPASTAVGTVTVVVGPVNDPPVANPDAVAVAEGGAATTLVGGAASVLANDTDADLPNDVLTVTLTPVVAPAHGTLVLNANGTFRYVHDGSENFSDSFQYTVKDAARLTDIGTVTITITPVNDHPPVANPETIAVAEGGTATALVGGATRLLANDTDADLPNDSLTVNTLPAVAPAHGRWS